MRLFLGLRSAFFWTLGIVHFFPAGTLLVLLGAFFGPRRLDPLLRAFCRNTVRCTGARFEVRRSPRFDPARLSFFVCNHVDIFDPMLVYSAIPQFVRGLELESHFRVPVYGWIMQRFGNVPVPAEPTTASVRLLKQRCRAALDAGTSLIVFPEGHRTLDGSVGLFRPGVFRMAREFGVAVVPMSIVGAFELKRKGSWMLRPARIVVRLHDTIDPAHPAFRDERALRDAVHAIVSEPVEWLRSVSAPSTSRETP
ncbi:MAG: lysophospholipid acyltransferase family protein [bacterium]